jgi:hypothetical protein
MNRADGRYIHMKRKPRYEFAARSRRKTVRTGPLWEVRELATPLQCQEVVRIAVRDEGVYKNQHCK